MGNKTSESQLKANKKWNEKNKEKMNHIRNKSGCKKYIENATFEELQEIECMMHKRKNELNG